MNFTYKAPEQCGIPSSAIKEYLEYLEQNGLSTHSIIIAKGNDILFEKYYKPFHKDFLHREYSDTKSLVGIAVGFAEQDGLVELDAPIGKYFPKETTEAENVKDPGMGQQTVRQMLMMSTPKWHIGWFRQRSADRVADYFAKSGIREPFGSRFEYDSQGSFVLAAMVERLTGMPFMEYLRIKLFDKIGVSKECRCLKAPGGHSWGDSAALMKAQDMLRVMRFLLDKGRIDGEQILNEKYLTEATSKRIDTHESSPFDNFGYGYQIWKTYEDGYLFNGMGCQFVVGIPGRDMIFVINSDNQGIEGAGQTVVGGFFDLVATKQGEPLPEDAKAYKELCDYADSLILASEKGEKHSELEKAIDGKKFVLAENPMGITDVTFHFGKNRGIMEYTNAQGAKSLPFGLCENCFTLFPEEGYSRDVGSVYTPGNYYKCASSAAWKDEKTLVLNEQVIDEYFGRLWMTFVFNGDKISVKMRKTAEDFFRTYEGEASGKAQ